MVKIMEEIVSHVSSKPQRVETVFVGQRFTVVRLVSGDVGLALTPLKPFDSCIGISNSSGFFTENDTSELAKFCLSNNSFLKAIGMAAINAVLQQDLKKRSDFIEGDFLNILRIKPKETVATIDYYTTKIGVLRRTRLMVFDDRLAGKRKDFQILPLSKMPARLSNADIVIFPPAFIDQIDKIRKWASRARELVLVHPTTPPLPKPFFKHGVTLVASMKILDANSLIRYVMEGAGTTLFKKFCQKIAFKLNS
jgi:uncharacterized protein (DUF4213/DUF364 family)